MPWFSKKKKRKVKKGVANISKDDAVVTATSKPLFAVVVQNFEASVSDQLSVERGQVVESLFVQENWIYIRNVNGQCGYVPGDFCFPLDKLRMGLSDNKNDQARQIRVHPRPTTIHVDTLERDEGGEEGAVGGGEDEEEEEVVNSPDSGISCSQQASSSNMESVQSFHTIRERLTAGSRNLEKSQNEEAGPSRGRTHARHKRFFDPNTSLPLLETVALPQQQQSTGGNCDAPHSPSPPPLPPVNLADLRQRREGITSPQQPSQQFLTAAVSGDHSEQQSPSSDTDDVFLPEAKKPVGIYQCAETYEPRFEGEMPLQRDEVVVVMEVGRGEWVWAVGTENKEGLVPKSLLHKYRPDIPEEREEFEEEQDMGEEREDGGERREEETMVLTNVRSSAAALTDTSTSATQTELIINGVVWEISSSVPTQQRMALTQPPDTATVSIQTEFTSPNWFQNNTPTPTPKNTLPRSTSISTTTHMHQEHTATQPNPSTRTTTAATSAQPKLLCAPRSSPATTSRQPPPPTAHPEPVSSASSLNPRTHTEGSLTGSHTPQRPSISVQSPGNGARRDVLQDSSTATPATECVAGNSTTTPQATRHPPGAGNATRGGPPCSVRGHLPVVSSNTGTIQRHRQALRQHVRVVTSVPFEPDNEAATNCTQSLAASRRRVQPTPIVTALRDYAPPQQAKNALALRKGDVMYAQPHVPYPYGWIWVYHTVLKKYGYVPKDYIAYMYLVQKDQGTILEDVV